MGKVVILKSSPRRNGNSAVLAERVKASIEEEGVEVEIIALHGLDIHPCDGCNGCSKTGECVIEDDMRRLTPKIVEADALVLASPIYFFTFNAQLKVCIDRWYAACNGRPDAFKGKRIGIVLTYGGNDAYDSGTVNALHTFETMFRFLEAEIVGCVYGKAGDVGDAEKQPEFLQRASDLGKNIALALRA